MHIIIDATTTQDQLAYAGPGQYTKNIILSLIKQYPEVNYSILLFNNKESTLGDISKYRNVEIVDIGRYHISNYMNDIWYFLRVFPKIKEIRQKNSIYFCPYFWANFPSYSMPTVLFVHDMNLAMFNMYSQISPIHNIIRGVQYWMTMYKSRRCKYILCNSKTTQEDFLKYFPKYPRENTGVSYLGVTIEEKEISLKDVLPHDYKEKGYLIYLGGGINKTKNSKGVINGYVSFLKMLGEKKNPPYLVIAGGKFTKKSKKEVKELYRIIKEEKVEKNVIFSGHYEDSQKYSLLKNSFASIHLSEHEGFGFSTIESLRSKTPTILNKNRVYQELFKDVSILINGSNAEEVGEVIYDVYKNPGKYRDMVERGYQTSRKYTWGNTAEKTYEVFKKISE